jgi:hypothetical protein
LIFVTVAASKRILILSLKIAGFAGFLRAVIGKVFGHLTNRTLHGQSPPCQATRKPIFTGDFDDWLIHNRTLRG